MSKETPRDNNFADTPVLVLWKLYPVIRMPTIKSFPFLGSSPIYNPGLEYIDIKMKCINRPHDRGKFWIGYSPELNIILYYEDE